eukprot:m.63915 g.63915  ORF g.63915 m.63915 type:complete len:935 (-) comp8094_c1_seq2:250-3054(-)
MPPGQRRRRRMPKVEEKSFAEHMATAADKAQRAQTRVLNSVRASVHSVETSRPFTPMDSSRGLFGTSRGFHSRVSSATSSATSKRVPRPPSAFTIGRRQFLENLPDTDYLERPRTGVRSHEAPTLTSSSNIVPPSSSSTEFRRRSVSTSLDSRPASRRRQNEFSTNRNGEDLGSESESMNEEAEVIVPPESDEPAMKQLRTQSSSSEKDVSITNDEIDSEEISPTPPQKGGRKMPKPPTSTNSKGGRLASRSHVVDGDGRRVASADRRRIASADVEEHDRWEHLQHLLKKLSVDVPTSDLLEVVLKIEKEIEVRGTFKTGTHNSELLRSLVRLTDMTDCRLLARLSRVILMITRSGTVKSVCKLLFKQSRSASNDAILVEEVIPDLLVAVLESCSVVDHTEALVYCCGAIKNLSTSGSVQDYFVTRGALSVMAAHLTSVVQIALLRDGGNGVDDSESSSTSYTGAKARSKEKMGNPHMVHFVVQLTAALRNLAVNSEHIYAFLSCGLEQPLCTSIKAFADEKDIVFNCIRILSKITAIDEGRDMVSACTGVVTTMTRSLYRHGGRKALCVRLLYVLGNLTIECDDNRHELFIASQNGENLLEMLEWRTRELVDVLTKRGEENVDEICGDVDEDGNDIDSSTRSVSRKKSAKGRKDNGEFELEDLVIKLVRVVANLCISEELGLSIAVQTRLSLLLDILRCNVIKSGHDDLLMNVVGCINNISFYQFDGNFVQQNMLTFAQVLVPFILSPNMDLFVEVARVFGNFSQSQEVRDLLVANRSDEVLCLLLAHDNRDVVYSVCGILINLLSDPEYRYILTKDDYVGLANLIDVMVVCGEEGGDWQTAGLACKALWNYADQISTQQFEEVPFMTETHMANVCDILADLTDDAAMPEDDFEAEMFMSEFHPVAVHLLQHVQACLNPLEPLEPLEPDNVSS